MRRVVVFLVVTAVLVAFAWWLAHLTGTVGASVGSFAMTLPTSWAVLALLVLLVVAYVFIRLLVMVVRLPARTRRMRAERARTAGGEAVTRTLLALAGGDSENAMQQAQRSRRLLGDTPQTLLLAAYAGRQGGHSEEADAAFNLLAARKDAAFLGLRGLLQGAIARGDWVSANALARQAEEVNPGTPWLRTERSRLAIQGGQWREALALASPGDPVAALGVAAAQADADPAQARRLAKQAWQTDPSFVPAALVYAHQLRDAGQEKKALDVLRTSWTRAPHPAIAEAYLSTSQAPAMRAARIEALAAAAPDHAESALLRARAALDAGKFADARRHAEAALSRGLTQRRVWRLLAEVGERDGDAVAAVAALHQAASAEPDPQWRCDACGTVHAEWHMVCSRCDATGQINWGTVAAGPVRPQLAHSGDPILP